jgi:hypothetical protein
MRRLQMITMVALAVLLAACSGQQTPRTNLPEKGNPEYFKVRDSMADEVYVNQDAAKLDWVDSIRRIYIAPANTSNTQIIQPHGVRASDIDAWSMDGKEDEVLQNKFIKAMTQALELDSAYTVVDSREKAQAVLHSQVIAIHPYEPRSVVEAGGKGGGAVTMSFALIDPSDDKVMIRLLDSKSSNDIWAFHNIDDDKTALDLIFEAWGYQIRRSVLFLQGRLSDADMQPAIQLKRQ